MEMSLVSLFSPENIASVCGFLIKPLLILLVCNFIINGLLKVLKGILGKTNLDAGIQGFARSAVKIGLWILTIIFIADSLGVNTASLVALMSVASLVLSLAVQGLFGNVFSGISILLTKPFVVGDFVEVAGVTGVVKEISLMRTTINTPDNKVELVPNGDIANSRITNYSKEPMRRVDFVFSVSYDASTEQVKNAVMEVVNADSRISKDSAYAPFVRLSGYNANDISYTVRVWVDNANYWDVYFDTMEAVRESFAKNGVEFSYPHTVVHLLKDN